MKKQKLQNFPTFAWYINILALLQVLFVASKTVAGKLSITWNIITVRLYIHMYSHHLSTCDSSGQFYFTCKILQVQMSEGSMLNLKDFLG